jgi:cobalt-zinc-cadmium efflux system outer membrane protein
MGQYCEQKMRGARYIPVFCKIVLWPINCLNNFVKLFFFVALAALLANVPSVGQGIPSEPKPQTSTSSGEPNVHSSTDESSTETLLQGGAAPQVLTLDDAIAMAERNSPRLEAASATVERANAAVKTARAYTNPTVEIYQGSQSARPVNNPGAPGILQHYAGYQTIEIPLERRNRTHTAQLVSRSTRFGQAGIFLSVVSSVKHAFYNVLRSNQEIQRQQENLQLVEDLRRRIEVQVRVGEVGRLELTRAEAELGHARYAVRSSQIELANAIALLRVAIAAPANANLHPVGTLEQPITLPPLEEVRNIVLRTHPEVARSQTDVQIAQSVLSHERSLRIPRPVLFAEFENQPDLRYWRAGVSIPIPLWDRRRGQIDESKAAIRQSNAALDERRLELISATERAYSQYQLADQQTTSLESGELKAAESAVEAAKAAYRFGERGIVEVLDAQRVLQTVRGDLLDAQYARQSALIDLEELGAIVPKGKP